MCAKHLERWKRNGTAARQPRPPVDPERKRCGSCREVKGRSEFRSDAGARDGLHGHCATCAARRSRERRAADPERARRLERERRLAKELDVSVEELRAFLADHDGRCDICHREPNGRGSLHLDHCHATGKLRGQLCHNCNVALGHLQDDPVRIRAAATYVELHAA